MLVLGAGPAGLATALALGDAAVVLERSRHPGGLSGSLEVDGAVFDVGGHSFWTPHAEVRRLVTEAVPMVELPRVARCWFRGQLVEYPFQRHFEDVSDPAVRAECRAGLAAADHGAAGGAPDFETYLTRRFGRGLADHFLLPYNRKLWGHDLRALSAGWTAERVAAPTALGESHDAARGERMPLQEDTRVLYPARGGFGEICAALSRRVVDLRLGSEAVSVDVARRLVRLADGAALPFRHLVSTLPLPELLRRMEGVPANLVELVGGLRRVSLSLVLVVVDAPPHTEVQRIHVADPDLLPHKVVLTHNSSPWLRSRPRHGVLAEIAMSPERPWSAGHLEARVVRDLVRVGALRRAADVLTTRRIDVAYGYPVPTHDRPAIVDRVRAWLASHGIVTLGRFGEWDYVNSDECLRRGLSVGRALAEALGGAAPHRGQNRRPPGNARSTRSRYRSSIPGGGSA